MNNNNNNNKLSYEIYNLDQELKQQWIWLVAVVNYGNLQIEYNNVIKTIYMDIFLIHGPFSIYSMTNWGQAILKANKGKRRMKHYPVMY